MEYRCIILDMLYLTTHVFCEGVLVVVPRVQYREFYLLCMRTEYRMEALECARNGMIAVGGGFSYRETPQFRVYPQVYVRVSVPYTLVTSIPNVLSIWL